jgi:hypothetical protein
MPQYFHSFRLDGGKQKLIPFTAPDDAAAWCVAPPGEDPGLFDYASGRWVRMPMQALAARRSLLAQWGPPIRKDTMQEID